MGWIMTAYGPMPTRDSVPSMGLAELATKLIGAVGEQKITTEQALAQAERLLEAEEAFAKKRDERIKKAEAELEKVERRTREMREALDYPNLYDRVIASLRSSIEAKAVDQGENKAAVKKACDRVFNTWGLGQQLRVELVHQLDAMAADKKALEKAGQGPYVAHVEAPKRT